MPLLLESVQLMIRACMEVESVRHLMFKEIGLRMFFWNVSPFAIRLGGSAVPLICIQRVSKCITVLRFGQASGTVWASIRSFITTAIFGKEKYYSLQSVAIRSVGSFAVTYLHVGSIVIED